MSYYASTSTHPSGQWLDIVGSSHLDGGKFVHLARHSRANLVVKERLERHDLQNHFCYFLPAWLVSIKLQISHIFFDIERVKFFIQNIINSTILTGIGRTQHQQSLGSKVFEMCRIASLKRPDLLAEILIFEDVKLRDDYFLKDMISQH